MIPTPTKAGSFLSLGPSGFHRIAFTDWGTKSGRSATVCVHGLTRNGRDFDVLAAALAERGRVVCPDMPGRGASDWLTDYKDYIYPTYLGDCAGLIAHINAARVDWIGTSMGGLIGMMLAASPGTPIRRLVMNDVGPFIPKESLVRIGHYVGAAPIFPDLAAADAYLRDIHAPFGSLTDEEWAHLASVSTVEEADGQRRIHYDPAIATTFSTGPIEDVDLWSVWDRIDCPVLVIRGAQSDLLTEATADEMSKRGPQADVVTIDGCGHAPALMAQDQIAEITNWLGE